MPPTKPVRKHTQVCHCSAHGGSSHTAVSHEQYGRFLNKTAPPRAQAPSPEQISLAESVQLQLRGPIPGIPLPPPPSRQEIIHRGWLVEWYCRQMVLQESRHPAALREHNRQLKLAQEFDEESARRDRERAFAKLTAQAPPLSHNQLPLPPHLSEPGRREIRRQEIPEQNPQYPVQYRLNSSRILAKTRASVRLRSGERIKPGEPATAPQMKGWMSKVSNIAKNKQDAFTTTQRNKDTAEPPMVKVALGNLNPKQYPGRPWHALKKRQTVARENKTASGGTVEKNDIQSWRQALAAPSGWEEIQKTLDAQPRVKRTRSMSALSC
ncbi:hypothetical protein FPQ18DRAFT_310570 [Pyronema domesticum]|uniref:Uncharacterized protein n=1 Tax=Pyronema omphalodes (strain CBS 100304) TaxID=1076935 RepID=U4L8R1_PYROM|nr:hypothetical protein FPQ18DRAFT_310570 [Pyronema domesticum]CCX13232.1 Protein of unknown function [Pyronema omphalodes CBS 100304]